MLTRARGSLAELLKASGGSSATWLGFVEFQPGRSSRPRPVMAYQVAVFGGTRGSSAAAFSSARF
jgi:hypothetical protein